MSHNVHPTIVQMEESLEIDADIKQNLLNEDGLWGQHYEMMLRHAYEQLVLTGYFVKGDIRQTIINYTVAYGNDETDS